MKYHDLVVTATKRSKRVGRGIAAGQGKTAGRGTKGQKSRTGSSRRPGFEGGQTPLMQRLPKLPGFRSIRPKAELVYTGQLNDLADVIDNKVVFEAGITTSQHNKVKLIVKGDVTKKVQIKLQSASQSAIKAIEKAGGSFEAVPRVARQKQEKPEK